MTRRQCLRNAHQPLLDSQRYGERWARHWLDVARYADSDGYEYDLLPAQPWRYRDYVIRAFNQDKPYNRFHSRTTGGRRAARSQLRFA